VERILVTRVFKQLRAFPHCKTRGSELPDPEDPLGMPTLLDRVHLLVGALPGLGAFWLICGSALGPPP